VYTGNTLFSIGVFFIHRFGIQKKYIIPGSYCQSKKGENILLSTRQSPLSPTGADEAFTAASESDITPGPSIASLHNSKRRSATFISQIILNAIVKPTAAIQPPGTRSSPLQQNLMMPYTFYIGPVFRMQVKNRRIPDYIKNCQ
jgi:hypothetical protein